MSETLITPPGEVLFANVLRPKTVRTRESEKLQYGIVLLQASPDTDPTSKAFIGSLHKLFMEKFGGNAKYGPNGRPWKKETQLLEDGTEQETGIIRITFSRDTKTRSGAELPAPIVQDAAGNAWPRHVAIGNGSLCKIAFSPFIWDSSDGGKGISLNLLAVRVIQHVPYQVSAVPDNVFGEPETGVNVAQLPAAEAAADPFGYAEGEDEEAPF